MTAYWLPACVFVLGSLGILAVRVGPEELATEIIDLDGVEQGLSVVIILVLITILAFIVRALTLPIAAVFAGRALPPALAAWSTRGQLRRKARTAHQLQANANAATATAREATCALRQQFPVHDADVQPTAFSNVLAAAGESIWSAYAMEVAVWWPRLEPFLPDAFLDTLASAQASMMGMLNLSVAFVALTLVAVVILGLAGALWGAAIVVLVLTLLLSRLCYGAAVSQAAEVGVRVNTAFDLYRADLLKQVERGHPSELAAERRRWRQLAGEVFGLSDPGTGRRRFTRGPGRPGGSRSGAGTIDCSPVGETSPRSRSSESPPFRSGVARTATIHTPALTPGPDAASGWPRAVSERPSKRLWCA